MYNTMMFRNLSIAAFALAVVVPLQASAYFLPEEVLLSRVFFLPPTAREAQDRAEQQVIRTTARRDREHELLENVQETAAAAAAAAQEALDAELFVDTEIATEETHGSAAPSTALENLSEEDRALYNAIRLLDKRQERLLTRVDSNQYEMQYYGANRLHGGAPPLAPTGAGGMLAALTMFGAVTWTIRKAKVAGRTTRIVE